MAKIGLIDNDLITRKIHNFPNLALMKLSSYHKKLGDDVRLISFDMINPMNLFTEQFDIIYVAKVFLDTETPKFIDDLPNVKKGGSGFYYDLAEKLPDEIEHSKPDYDLYKNYKGKYYQNYSIGFITRGCIRQCPFCINKNYKKVSFHSNPNEFIDEKKPFIMLLDDNITAYKDFEGVFNELNSIGKPFVFKQGMDFRLLTLKKMNILWKSNYLSKGLKTFHFAFDNIEDYNQIEKKLKIYYENTIYKHNIWFYVLTGFNRNEEYDINFYQKDFIDLLKRIELLFKYNAHPYIMLHEKYKESPYKEAIRQIARICNFAGLIGKKTFGDSLKKSRYTTAYSTIKTFAPEYLGIKINSIMFKNIKF